MSNGHGRSTEGFGISREQSVRLIVRTCLDNGVTNPRQIAYILATAQHETRDFTAPEEDFGRSQARKLGYRGGEEYFGRGYVHLTHRDNYEEMDRRLGLGGALVRDPRLATDPEIAARIIVVGMRDGLFTGRRLDRYIDEDSTDLYNARRTVNGVVASKPWSVNAAHECERFTRDWQQQMPTLIEAAQRDALRARSGAGHRNQSPPDAVATRPGRTPFSGNASEHAQPAQHPAAVILSAAERHFLTGHARFEYGRPDMTLRNADGNRRTDGSRNERDLDGDGLRGVDCSAFVWRGLKNAGYDVPSTPFTTRTLFDGRHVTSYARSHFQVIPGHDAQQNGGPLEPGDILLFKDKDSGGQHVGIFKAYDANGRIQFIGSQVSTGPAQAGAGQGSYWNGGEFEIVGALRAKPEFQVRSPLHASANDRSPAERLGAPATVGSGADASSAQTNRSADADGQLRHGEDGPPVARLQQRLADLGYRGKDGKPLAIDGDFGDNTRFALRAFQRETGLEGKGVAGPKTGLALERAERALMSHPSHPHHALYTQVLEKVHAEERAKGIPSGHHSKRIAAALAVECLREGITRVDRVELNRDTTLVRGVEVSPVRDEPGLNRTTDAISTRQASQQPMRESSEQIQQVAVNQLAQQREEQRATRPAPALP